MRSPSLRIAAVALLVASTEAVARTPVLPEGMTFYNGDFEGWKAATPGFTTIDFTGLEHGTTIYDQYAELGVLFTSPGPPKIAKHATYFVQDGWGIDGNWNYVELTFLAPMYAVAWHHGPHFLEVYSGEELIATTPLAMLPSPGQKFGGLTSSIAFDRVRIRTPSFMSQVWIDNIYFAAAPIPSPAAAFAIAGLLLGCGRRRRE